MAHKPDDCLHCFIAVEIGKRLDSGACPKEIFADLVHVIAEYITCDPRGPAVQDNLIEKFAATLRAFIPEMRAACALAAMPAGEHRH